MKHKQLASELLSAALSEQLSPKEIFDLLEKPKSSQNGDIAFPTFSLAKRQHRATTDIAAELAAQLSSRHFEAIKAVGPYVNFFLLKSEVTQEVIQTILKQGEKYGNQNLGHNGNVPIDMSSPNIAKPFSIGHLRSTVIGDSLARIYKKIGYQPIKINHLGDWGKQFGLLIAAYKHWGSERKVSAHPIDELLKLYVKINAAIKKDPELDAEGRAWFKRMEEGDEGALTIWRWFSEVSLLEFNRIYNKLGITFDYFTGESFYSDKMEAVVEQLTKKQLLQESKGALVVDLTKYDLNPALIKKTDGATLYITRDLATAIYRRDTFNFVKSLYVVGNEQSNHFKQLKAVLKEMDFDWADEMVHIPFGMVTQGGHKFSTRQGHVVKLEMALDEAIDRALAQIEEKNPKLKNKKEIAQQVGVGAIKFYDLKTDRLNGYDFDLETMVSFEGETGPYVQYSYTRIQSLLRKADYQGVESEKEKPSPFAQSEHWEIIKLLQNFPEVIRRAADKYEPSIIAKYAILLAQTFNKYYAQVRILEPDAERGARLQLCQATAIVLKEALDLLGIAAPEQM